MMEHISNICCDLLCSFHLHSCVINKMNTFNENNIENQKFKDLNSLYFYVKYYMRYFFKTLYSCTFLHAQELHFLLVSMIAVIFVTFLFHYFLFITDNDIKFKILFGD